MSQCHLCLHGMQWSVILPFYFVSTPLIRTTAAQTRLSSATVTGAHVHTFSITARTRQSRTPLRTPFVLPFVRTLCVRVKQAPRCLEALVCWSLADTERQLMSARACGATVCVDSRTSRPRRRASFSSFVWRISITGQTNLRID